MSRPDARSGPDFPEPGAETAFAEPWQAHAFAMVVALHQRGLFAWEEWVAVLSRELERTGADPEGRDYYDHWLAALERLLSDKDIAAADEIAAMAAAWQRAAHATPHGRPIVIENDPRRGA